MKKGQMKLSFGMIFSIILIIVFVAFAFYVIKIILDNQKTSTTLLFVNDLQEHVNKAWNTQGSQEKSYILPKKIEKVCLVDYSSSAKGKDKELYRELKKQYFEFENLFFYPVDYGNEAREIEHLDIEKITEKENPYCIENINKKVKMIIKKDFNENLVTIIK